MTRLAGIFFSVVLLGGCASVPTQYHLLRAQSEPAAQVMANEQSIYALRHLDLPNYLSDTIIAYWQADHQLTLEKDHRWAEPLSDNVRDVLSQQIQDISGKAAFYQYPLAYNIRPDVIIDVQIKELIADTAERDLKIRADWQISNAGERNPMSYRFNQRYPLESGDINAIVAAHQKALLALSQAIAEAL
ncbi:PqiC family protein [Suttonella sp. R2A3]|uniref:PqiC family protein n=1 Tax=Suttonella sp. R2A3 TaxID=2908648 RepID=UPI001F21A016|nr:PqiC family protein [Suttonella sp. R2A3]UJF25364.1 PqiC family protein [Suttonella sp. R2A3]